MRLLLVLLMLACQNLIILAPSRSCGADEDNFYQIYNTVSIAYGDTREGIGLRLGAGVSLRTLDVTWLEGYFPYLSNHYNGFQVTNAQSVLSVIATDPQGNTNNTVQIVSLVIRDPVGPVFGNLVLQNETLRLGYGFDTNKFKQSNLAMEELILDSTRYLIFFPRGITAFVLDPSKDRVPVPCICIELGTSGECIGATIMDISECSDELVSSLLSTEQFAELGRLLESAISLTLDES